MKTKIKVGQISPGGPTIGFMFISTSDKTNEYEPMTLNVDGKKIEAHPTFLKGDAELLRARLHASIDMFIDSIDESSGKANIKPWNPS